MTVRVNGQLIRELRLKRSYSQEALAELVGVNLRTIQRIETNGVAALSTRRALADALGVTPEALDSTRPSGAEQSKIMAIGRRSRWLLPSLSLCVLSIVFGTAVLSISINSAMPMGLVTLPAVGGLLVALVGFAMLARLVPLPPRWRIYAFGFIAIVAMWVSPPAWTLRALVAILLWAAFEAGNLVRRFGVELRTRHPS